MVIGHQMAAACIRVADHEGFQPLDRKLLSMFLVARFTLCSATVTTAPPGDQPGSRIVPMPKSWPLLYRRRPLFRRP